MSELFTLSGHQAPVAGLSFSADGRLLASAGSSDATVRIWDLAEGMELQTLACGDGDTISCVAFAPDGKTVVAGRTYRHPYGVHVWDVEPGKELASWKEDGMVNAVAFAPDGSTFAIATYGGKVKMFDTATRKERHCFEEHNGEVFSLAYSPDGKVLASGGYAEVRLWDVARGKQRIGRTAEAGPPVVGLTFSPDGKGLFIGMTNTNGGVWLWDTVAHQDVESFQSPPKKGRGSYDDVKHLALSPDGKVLAVPLTYGEIQLVDAITGEVRTTFVASQEGFVSCVAFTPDGKALASAGYEPVVKFWDVASLLK